MIVTTRATVVQCDNAGCESAMIEAGEANTLDKVIASAHAKGWRFEQIGKNFYSKCPKCPLWNTLPNLSPVVPRRD